MTPRPTTRMGYRSSNSQRGAMCRSARSDQNTNSTANSEVPGFKGAPSGVVICTPMSSSPTPVPPSNRRRSDRAGDGIGARNPPSSPSVSVIRPNALTLPILPSSCGACAMGHIGMSARAELRLAWTGFSSNQPGAKPVPAAVGRPDLGYLCHHMPSSSTAARSKAGEKCVPAQSAFVTRMRSS